MWSVAVNKGRFYWAGRDSARFQNSHKGAVLIFIQWICYSEIYRDIIDAGECLFIH